MRGSQVTHLLYSKIEEKSGKSREEAVQCLLDICDVFESREVDSESLKEHGMSMRRAISSKRHTFLLSRSVAMWRHAMKLLVPDKMIQN